MITHRKLTNLSLRTATPLLSRTFLICGVALFGPSAHAEGWEAEVELEASWFPQHSPNPRSDYASNGSVATTLSRTDYWGDAIFDTKIFYREDGHDENRSHLDVRDLLVTLPIADFEFKAGIGGAFWGFVESVNIVDVINQTDLVEGLDGDAKLGQPMLAANWYGPLGTFETFVMPVFRPQTFPSADGRPAVPLPVTENDDDYQYESSQRENHVDYAARWSNSLGPFDLALSWFKGTERDPRSVVCFGRGTGRPNTANGPNCDLPSGFPDPGLLGNLLFGLGLVDQDQATQDAITDALPDLRLIPHYDQTERYGLELQWNLGDVLVKAEALYATQLDEPYRAAVGGFEYTWASPFGLGLDARIISEYLYDDRDTEIYLNLFDDDIFFGSRLEFQDSQSTTILVGAIYDRNNYAILYLFEATRRLSDTASLSLEALAYSHLDHTAPSDKVSFFSTADTVTAKLSLFF